MFDDRSSNFDEILTPIPQMEPHIDDMMA